MIGSQITPGPNLSGKAKVANHSKAKYEMTPKVKKAKKTILTHNQEERQSPPGNYSRTGLRRREVPGHKTPIYR